MSILITGATGFIGRHVLRVLLRNGNSVQAVIRDGHQDRLPAHPALRIISGGLKGPTTAELAKCSTLIHLAAYGVVSGMNDWDACFRINVTESLNLFLKAADAGVQRMIICGSCFEYGLSAARYEFIPTDAPLEPTGAYHASKAAATMAACGLATDRQIRVSILRPFHVFGEGENPNRFWPSLMDAALNGRDFKMTKGEQIRDFVPVEDVAKSFVEEANLDRGYGRAFIKNLGTGYPQSLAEFAGRWWQRSGARGKLIFGAIPYRPNEVMRYVPDLREPSSLRNCIDST